MSDVTRAKNELDAKLASMGYVHPEKPQMGHGNLYKTIDVKDEKAVYQSSKVRNPYRNFTEQEEPQEQVQRTDICPRCDTKALYRCECQEFGDQMCQNNHVWWVNKQGQIINGDPHDLGGR
jgi:hypothetical protein